MITDMCYHIILYFLTWSSLKFGELYVSRMMHQISSETTVATSAESQLLLTLLHLPIFNCDGKTES